MSDHNLCLTVNEIRKVLKVPMYAGQRVDHYRAYPGLILTVEGSVSFYYHGKEYVSDPNHPLLMPQEVNYMIESNDDSCSVVINFACTSPYYSDVIMRCRANFGNQAIRAERLWLFKHASYHSFCMATIYEVLTAFEAQAKRYTPSSKYRKILPSIEYMEEHFTDPTLTNEQLAAISGVSTVYFRKIFTQTFGVSPMRYVRMKRMEKAKDLLSSQFYSTVSQVAEQVGYECAYDFSRAFKIETLISPSEYMKRTQPDSKKDSS